MFQANQATPWLFVGAPFRAEVMLIVRSRREPLTFNQRVLGSSPSALPYVRGVKVARPRGKLKSGVASDGPEPSPKLKRGRTMEQHRDIFIGLDTSKLKISVAVANGERNGEARFYGDIPSDPGSVRSMVDKLATRGARLHFCYEAGPTGYDLHRQIIAMGHDCVVVAPSLIPKRPGDRVKTNRRPSSTPEFDGISR